MRLTIADLGFINILLTVVDPVGGGCSIVLLQDPEDAEGRLIRRGEAGT